MKPQFPSIQSFRLKLQPQQNEDAEVLYQIYHSEGVLRYFPNPNPPALEKVKQFIIGQHEHWQKHGYGNWGLLPEGETNIIGWAGLQYLPELDETEVGFLLNRPWWGLGYATVAARAILQLCFSQVRLDHIIALVHPENLASQRVIEKFGMTYMETLSLWGIDLMGYRVENPFLHEIS